MRPGKEGKVGWLIGCLLAGWLVGCIFGAENGSEVGRLMGWGLGLSYLVGGGGWGYKGLMKLREVTWVG